MNFNFSLILFWLLVVTGVVWFADLLWFRPRRVREAARASAAFDAQRAARPQASVEVLDAERTRVVEDALRQPGWIEFPAGFFPVILVVFLLRSFLFEPFRIPSGSMIPTLLVGDLILVNKFDYGVRLPILNKKIIEVGSPQRGDVMVFRYPKDPEVDFIKRVIGVPGDTITYRNKRLEVNGQPAEVSTLPEYFDTDRVVYSQQFLEKLPSPKGPVDHAILNDAAASGKFDPENFPFQDHCSYSDGNTAVTCTVPAGQYFMMGDNRDNSADSRYWGFVPDENIVGKAFFIWMNFGNIKRIGSFK